MLTYLYAEIDVIGIIIMTIIYFSVRHKQHILEQDLFNLLLLALSSILFFDACMWVVENTSFPFSREINYIVTTIYYFFPPVIGFLTFLFVLYKATGDEKRIKRSLIIFSLPVIINIVFLIINPFKNCFFFITEENKYMRGDLFWLSILFCFVYILSSEVALLHGIFSVKYSSVKNDCVFIACCLLIPIVGGMLQAFFYGLQLTWICSVISILILYINIQNKQIYYDAMTKLNNRTHLYKYLAQKTKHLDPENNLYVIIIDIDKFKFINDTYGHFEGDNALAKISQLLKSICSIRNDYVARLAGDEFTIVCIRKKSEEIFELPQIIDKYLEDANNSSFLSYPVSLSYGYAIYGEDDTDTVDKLMYVADNRMYSVKTSKRNQIC